MLLSQSILFYSILYDNLQSTLLQVYEGFLAWTQLNDMSYTMGPSVYTWTVCYTHVGLYLPPPYSFDCVILQVIVLLRASLNQLIISAVVIIHQNNSIHYWPQIVTSNDLVKCCHNLATLFRTQVVKKFAHRFLTISCSGGSMVSYFFHLVNLKLVSRPMWISNCKKICCQKLFNMDKTYDFIMKPLKIWSLGNVVSRYFFTKF